MADTLVLKTRTWYGLLMEHFVSSLVPVAGEFLRLTLWLSIFPHYHFAKVPATASSFAVMPYPHPSHLLQVDRFNDEFIGL